MKIQKQFRIGHVAALLGVQRFVIRFWEKEFNLTSSRSEGGQRFYKQKDVERFKMIQQLLYEKKFTIAGAKEILGRPDSASATITKNNYVREDKRGALCDEHVLHKILDLHKKLCKLRELL